MSMLFTITEKGLYIPYFMQNTHMYLDLTLVPLAAYFVWPHAARTRPSIVLGVLLYIVIESANNFQKMRFKFAYS